MCYGIWELERNQGANLDQLAVYGTKLYKDIKTTPVDITGAVAITHRRLPSPSTHFNDIGICVQRHQRLPGSGPGRATPPCSAAPRPTSAP